MSVDLLYKTPNYYWSEIMEWHKCKFQNVIRWFAKLFFLRTACVNEWIIFPFKMVGWQAMFLFSLYVNIKFVLTDYTVSIYFIASKQWPAPSSE